jgi:hypothetical protein
MSNHEHPMPVRSAGAGSSRMTRAKPALGNHQTLSGTARDAPFAYAMTGSAVAKPAIMAAPHLEMLAALRLPMGRGRRARAACGAFCG